jgi:hypothetical protein
VEIYAHIDETGTRLHDGRRLYGLAAVLTDGADHALVATTMSGLLLPAQRWLITMTRPATAGSRSPRRLRRCH